MQEVRARRLAPAVVMLVAGLGLLVAAVGAGAHDEARKGGTLRLATFQEVDSVDTALAYSPWSSPITYATCAKLFNLPDAAGAEGTKVVPEVVRAWTLSRDGRTYTFDLKRTFRFHTGARVTAQSFADAFDRDADPRMRSPATDFMREIEGAAAVTSGMARSVSGIRVLGPYRLRIRLTQPVGDFTARLTLPFFCPVAPGTPPAETNEPAGSGPYYVADRVVNQQIVLKRNSYYRGDRPANVSEVVWKTAVSRDDCLAAVQQDLLDHCVHFSIPNVAYRALEEQYGLNRPGGQLFVDRGLGTFFLVFNHDREAFKGRGQIPLKKAINFAIDRTALTRPMGYLAGRRTDQLLPPALGARVGSIYPLEGSNMTAARRWLERARVKPPRLVLYVTNSSTQVVMGQSVAFDLGRLGIDVDVRHFDAEDLDERLGTRGEPFDIAVNGWATDYADGGSFLEPILNGRDLGPNGSTGNINTSYFDDPQTNVRIEAAMRLPVGDARRKAWADLDADVMRTNPPVAPIIHTNNRAFISKSFGCFLFHPLYGVDIAAACKK
jgi:peptide/nickel transport system substrate-binding protein